MSLANFAEQPLVFDINDKLSKVISKLYSEKMYEGFVFDRGQFIGIISAKDIVRKGVMDPEKTKLSNLKGIIRNMKIFGEDVDFSDVINNFLINNCRCVPVEKGGEILSLTKIGMLNTVPSEAIKGKTASDIMFFPECVSSYDPLSVAKSTFRNSHVYRLAVIGKDEKTEGVVDDIDLLRGFVERTTATRGEKSGEKVKENNVPISSHIIMQGSYLSVSPNTELKYVIKAMLDKKQDTVIVEEDKKLLGMITPREILKLIAADIGGVYVTISGIHDEDAFIQGIVDSDIHNSIRKLAKIIHIHYVTLNVKKKVGGKSSDYKVKTKRTNYTVVGRIVSNKGSFFADDVSWDLTKSTKAVLKKLEIEVSRQVGKGRARDAGHHGEDEIRL